MAIVVSLRGASCRRPSEVILEYTTNRVDYSEKRRRNRQRRPADYNNYTTSEYYLMFENIRVPTPKSTWRLHDDSRNCFRIVSERVCQQDGGAVLCSHSVTPTIRYSPLKPERAP